MIIISDNENDQIVNNKMENYKIPLKFKEKPIEIVSVNYLF